MAISELIILCSTTILVCGTKAKTSLNGIMPTSEPIWLEEKFANWKSEMKSYLLKKWSYEYNYPKFELGIGKKKKNKQH